MNHLSSPWFCFSSKQFLQHLKYQYIFIYLFISAVHHQDGEYFVFSQLHTGILSRYLGKHSSDCWVCTLTWLSQWSYFLQKKSRGFMFSLRVEFQCLSGRWNSVGSLEDFRRTRCVSPAPEVAQKCQEESVLHDFFPHPPSCVVSETWASSYPTCQLPSQVPRWDAVLKEWVLHEPPHCACLILLDNVISESILLLKIKCYLYALFYLLFFCLFV